MDKYPSIEWNKDNDNFEVLNKTDLLISDYSGIIFDYSLIFEKPIIYTSSDFDDSIYDSTWLNAKPWTFKKLREIGTELNENNLYQLKELINDCIYRKKNKKKIEQIKKECWANEGNAASTIVDYIMQKINMINN